MKTVLTRVKGEVRPSDGEASRAFCPPTNEEQVQHASTLFSHTLLGIQEGLLVWSMKPGMDNLMVWTLKPLVADMTGLGLKIEVTSWRTNGIIVKHASR
jgi:hypothetical protein